MSNAEEIVEAYAWGLITWDEAMRRFIDLLVAAQHKAGRL